MAASHVAQHMDQLCSRGQTRHWIWAQLRTGWGRCRSWTDCDPTGQPPREDNGKSLGCDELSTEDPKWQMLAEYLEHLARDPNWRRSPSILDQLRGWRITPGRPKSTRLSSASGTGG